MDQVASVWVWAQMGLNSMELGGRKRHISHTKVEIGLD